MRLKTQNKDIELKIFDIYLKKAQFLGMIKQLLSFKGRVGRMYYLLILVLTSLINIITGPIPSTIDLTAIPTWSAFLLHSVETLVLVFSAYISIVTAIKRFHDMNMSGWHELIREVLMVVVWFFLTFVWVSQTAQSFVSIIFIILCIIVLAVYGFKLLFDRGTNGQNRFGETTMTVKDMFRKSAKH